MSDEWFDKMGIDPDGISEQAKRAAKNVIEDLRRNRDLDRVWSGLNEATQADVEKVWAAIIDEEFRP